MWLYEGIKGQVIVFISMKGAKFDRDAVYCLIHLHRLLICAGSSPPTQKGEKVAAALAVSCSVPAHKLNSLEFCLAWDMPRITFGSREREHVR